MVRASAVTTGGTSIIVPTTAERAASRARSRWRATWSRMMSACSSTFCASGSAGLAAASLTITDSGVFKRMGEIADMGAGALDDLAVGLDQRIGFARKRSDLDREFALAAARRGRSGWPRGLPKYA